MAGQIKGRVARGEEGESRVARDFIRSTRTSFAINYTMTLVTVALLLVATFASLKAQESSSSAPSLNTISQAKATQTNSLTATSTISPATDKPPSSSSTSEYSSSTAASASKKTKGLLLPMLSASTSSPESHSIRGAHLITSSGRQPRATRKHSSTTSSSASTEAENLTTALSSGEAETTADEPEKVVVKKKVVSTTSASKATPSKKKQQELEEIVGDEEATGEENADEEREKVSKRKKKTKHNTSSKEAIQADTGSSTPLASTSEISTARNSKQSLSGATPSSLITTESSSSTIAAGKPAHKRRPIEQPSSTNTTNTTTTATNAMQGKKKAKPGGVFSTNQSTSESSENYEDEVSSDQDDTTHKPLDISKIKLVGLNQYNESTALSQSISGSTQPTITRPKSELFSLPAIKIREQQTTVADNSSSSSSLTAGSLDARSPSSQTSSSLAKRITNILADSKSKLLRQTPMTTISTLAAATTSTSHSLNTNTIPKFSYSKPFSSTTMMTPFAIGLNDSMFVQVINQSEPLNSQNQSVGQPTKIGVQGEGLDWSKLVKVVFKSTNDNHTLYTVVMNSSELSNHPINDWSSELPNLLERDFEKLVQKWSNVFPIDHLGKIIISKVNDISSGDNSTPAILADKLNSTLSLKGTNTTKTPTTTTVPTATTLKTIIFGGNTKLSTPQASSSMAIGDSNQTDCCNSNVSTNSLKEAGHNQTTPSLPVLIGNVNSTSPSLESISSSNKHDIKLQSNATSSISDTNSSLIQSSPRPINVLSDFFKSSTPWSSSVDLSSLASQDNTIQRRGPQGNVLKGTNSTFVIVGSPMLTGANEQQKTKLPSTSREQSSLLNSVGQESGNNRSIVEMIKDMNKEHSKIENNVKEQANSLRHFIIVCSIAVVLATSLAVALIVFLIK